MLYRLSYARSLAWSGRADSNRRPHGPKPCALTKLSYAPDRSILYPRPAALVNVSPPPRLPPFQPRANAGAACAPGSLAVALRPCRPRRRLRPLGESLRLRCSRRLRSPAVALLWSEPSKRREVVPCSAFAQSVKQPRRQLATSAGAIDSRAMCSATTANPWRRCRVPVTQSIGLAKMTGPKRS